MNTKVILIGTLAIIALLAALIFISVPFTPTQTGMTLQGEAGLYRNGEFYPLSIWTVNAKTAQDGDVLYWRFWLTLTAQNVDGQLTSVRFTLWQKGLNEAWIMGTEGVTPGNPATSPTELWFQTALPNGVPVTMPIKYRDVICEGAETISNPLPYSTWDSATSTFVRAARVEKLFADRWPIGTTTWELHCTVVALTWQYFDGTSTKTETVTSSPSDIYFTFSITRTEVGGLTVTLVGQGSH